MEGECQSRSPPGDGASRQVRSGSQSERRAVVGLELASQGLLLEKQQLVGLSMGHVARREVQGSSQTVAESVVI